ncbi:hypothetical protein BN871_DQ_00030 [Paenibacillus sp. P22]|nr:hypothetical protein BN871_DQ_00030 [Paenibacillus sp. P22]
MKRRQPHERIGRLLPRPGPQQSDSADGAAGSALVPHLLLHSDGRNHPGLQRVPDQPPRLPPERPGQRLGRTVEFQVPVQHQRRLGHHPQHAALQHRLHRPRPHRFGRHGDRAVRDRQQAPVQAVPDRHVPALFPLLGHRRLLRLQLPQPGQRPAQPDPVLHRNRPGQLVQQPRLLAFHPRLHQPVEGDRLQQRRLPGFHHGHRPLPLRGRDDRRREQVAADPQRHDSDAEAAHDHSDAARHRQDLLRRLRPVLPGAPRLRHALLRHQRHRHLCLPRLENDRRIRNGDSRRPVSELRRLYARASVQLGRTPLRQGQLAVLECIAKAAGSVVLERIEADCEASGFFQSLLPPG